MYYGNNNRRANPGMKQPRYGPRVRPGYNPGVRRRDSNVETRIFSPFFPFFSFFPFLFFPFFRFWGKGK